MSGVPGGLCLAAVLLSGLGQAPEADKEQPLPPPRLLPRQQPESVVVPVHPAYRRTSRYAIWEYYGVDRSGNFRPQVIWGPSGAYYLIDGQPYFWPLNHPLEYMGYIVH